MKSIRRKWILAVAVSLCTVATLVSVVVGQHEPTEAEYAAANAAFVELQINLGNYTPHQHQLRNYLCSPSNITCNAPGAICTYLVAGAPCTWCDGSSQLQTFCLDAPNQGTCYMTGPLPQAQLKCGRQGSGTCVGGTCTGAATTPASPACHAITCTA